MCHYKWAYVDRFHHTGVSELPYRALTAQVYASPANASQCQQQNVGALDQAFYSSEWATYDAGFTNVRASTKLYTKCSKKDCMT